MSGVQARLREHLPGLLLCFTVAIAATFLSEHYGAPAMLFALLLGMAFHFLSEDARFIPGIELTAKRLLRIGVALLGTRITTHQVAELGTTALVLVPALVFATIAFGLAFARLMGRGFGFGMLTGGAVAICGASAALAIAAALPQRDREKDTLFTVFAVTALSTLAMIVYPIIYALLGFSDGEIGLLIGATIHDVAQVVGAGYAVSEEAGDVSTLVKLMRVAMLPLVVLAVAFVTHRRSVSGKGVRPPMPWFALAFAALLLANSGGFIPYAVGSAMSDLSRWFLVGAIAALGVKTSIKAMTDLGARHLAVIIAETLFLLIAALAVAESLKLNL